LGDVVAEGSGESFHAAAGAALDRVARMIARGLGRLSGRRKGRTSMAGERMHDAAETPPHEDAAV
jgi:hypothetical protein